jgi:hypothetical protein
MSKKCRITYDRMPVKLPIVPTVVLILLGREFQWSPLVWGAVGALATLVWIAHIVALAKAEMFDPWEKTHD